MSTLSGLHLEQLQEVVEQLRAEIERWKLTVDLRDAEIERLTAANAELLVHVMEVRSENEQLRATIQKIEPLTTLGLKVAKYLPGER